MQREDKQSVLIVAELSANHNGDIENCFKLIDSARNAGADAIKIQTYTPDTMTINSNREEFTIRGTIWDERQLYDLYSEAALPWEWHEKLFAYCRKTEIELFSTPFDKSAVDLLEQCGVKRYKIASSELIDLPLIKYVAEKGKPIIMSTGMASYDEIVEAVDTVKSNGNGQPLTLLKCTASYPAPVEDANLLTIPDMRKHFGCPVGLSDHTLDNVSCIMSIAHGATVIEKHFTLDRSFGGPDSAFSLEPDEFATLVADVRKAELAQGGVFYGPVAAEKNSVNFRRSLYVVNDIRQGEIFTDENLRSIRPALGLKPKYLVSVLGKRAAFDISAGTPLSAIMVEGLKIE